MTIEEKKQVQKIIVITIIGCLLIISIPMAFHYFLK